MLNKLKSIDRLFGAIVIAPTVMALIYFGLIASPIYISRSSFVVYSPNQQASQSSLVSLLSTLGGRNSTDAAETISTYTTSWSALTALNEKFNLRSIYGSRGIDIFNRFGGVFYPFTSTVRLWRYYQHMVSDGLDASSGISTLVVKAYTPEDAEKINAFLLAKGQDIVNELNKNARERAVSYAQQDVDSAKQKFQKATLALANYRNGQMVFDPATETGSQINLIEQLESKLINATVELNSLEAHAPANPQISTLRTTISSLKAQITQQSKKITGSGVSLASKDTQYQILTVNLLLAQSLLESAVTSLEQARTTAQKQELYLETISAPNLPDAPELPNRIDDILATIIVTLMVWGIVRIIVGGVREHKNH